MVIFFFFLNLQTILSSVLQWAISSLNLHNVYVNNIVCKSGIKLAKFANDTAVIFTDNNPHKVNETFQNYLDEYLNWLKKWHIKVDPRKSTAILFTLKNFTPSNNIKLNNEPIPGN